MQINLNAIQPARLGTHTEANNMEVVNYYLNIIHKYFSEGKKRTVSANMTESGLWILCDDELEVAGLVVIRYMLDNNLKTIGTLSMSCPNDRCWQLYDSNNWK